MNKIHLSKYLSLILRHNPGTIGLELDQYGWADVEVLIEKSLHKDKRLTFSKIEEVVKTSEKKRFSFNQNKTKIKANYGHSISIKMESLPEEPPEILYHGTVKENFDAIRKNGLQQKNRQFVHLSKDRESAKKVGERHGKAQILQIMSKKMYLKGFSFFRSPSNIWLVEYVPAEYLIFPK